MIESRRDPGRRIAHWIPVAVGIAFLAIGVRELYVGHPHEDAFILFEYARHLANGDGIVFYAGGPHAEGATDFLWMLLLAGSTRLGLDVALAAVLWNAVGAWLASHLLARRVLASALPGPFALGLVTLTGVVLGTSAALAGWAGFGAMLYAALALLCVELAVARAPSAIAWAPFAALTLALVRPDGVVIGAVAGLASFLAARRAVCVKRWTACAFAAVLLGGAYFAWRRAYFGLDLPLPLYVKSNGANEFELAGLFQRPLEVLPGLGMTLRWMQSRLGPLPMLAVLVLLGACVARRDRRAAFESCVGVLAAVALLFLLCFGRQTQNHAFRFQAPAALLLLWSAWRLMVPLSAGAVGPRVVRCLAPLALLGAALPACLRTAAQFEWNERAKTYLDVFPARLGPLLGSEATVVLTEAGRVPFWTDARTSDAVGLNTAEFALAPPSVEDLARLRPDVVFFHVADALALHPGAAAPPRPVHALSADELAACVTPVGRDVYEHGLARWTPGQMPESVAPAVLARFLVLHPDHELRAVLYLDGFVHLWAFRRDLPRLDAILDALDASQPRSAWRSYAELARLPGAR